MAVKQTTKQVYKMKNSTYNTIKQQWDQMLGRGIMPLIEYQIRENDWLTCDIELTEKGIVFSFDEREATDPKFFFSGDVMQLHPENYGRYLLPFDEYFDDLDHYLQQIDQEMTEGFLLPNDLYYTEQDE